MMQWPSIKMDDLNGFYGLINYPLFPSLILLYANQALGIFLTCLDTDGLLYLQLLSSSRMVVFLWRLLSICLLKVFLDIWGIIAWSWKWANFLGRSFFVTSEEQANFFGRPFFMDDHFLSLLKSKVISLDAHFWSLRYFFFHSFSGRHIWYSWFACDLRLCENSCLFTLI